jgi:hypothetical protein
LPGGGTWRWLRCSTIAVEQVWKNIGNPLATGYSLAWWRNQEMVALFNHYCRLGRILATLLKLINYLPGGGTWRWLPNLTTAAGWEEYWQPSCQ